MVRKGHGNEYQYARLLWLANTQRGIYLPDEMAERITALAQSEDRSWNAMLRVLVKEALESRCTESEKNYEHHMGKQ